jgi:aldehyde dehydrogenase (NAD+)
MFFAGEWRTGRSNGINQDRNPYTGETLVEIPQEGREDLNEACIAGCEG